MNILVSPLSVKINPYIDLFYSALKQANPQVKLLPFRLCNFFKSIDLCHFHWPEAFLNKKSFINKLIEFVSLYIKITILKILKVKLVWTVHNFRPHECIEVHWIERLFYKFWISSVDAFIFLTDASRIEFFEQYNQRKLSKVIPHGHYKDIYQTICASDRFKNLFQVQPKDFIIGHYGLIRRYKNIPRLIRQFKYLEGDDYKLIIAGSIHKADSDLREEIKCAADGDDRIFLHFDYIEHEEIKELYEFTNLAVFPYDRVTNSGSALLALSFNCPVIVPDNPYMKELKDTIASSKVLFFKGDAIFNEYLLEGIDSFTGIKKDKEEINLSYYDWSKIGIDTDAFFQVVIDL